MSHERRITGRRSVIKGIGAGFVGGGLAGCLGGGGGGGDGGDGGDGGSTTQQELEATPIVLPHFGLWETSIGFLAGQEHNFFADEGLEVSRVDTSGGGGNVRTVVSGDADIGHATGIASLFAAYREGTNVRIVSNSMNQASDMFWYAMADSEYEGIDDLSGADVGFSSPGSSTNMVALKATEGVDSAKAVSVGGPPDANAALEGGEVDMAWSVPPFFMKGVNEGKYKIVFRGSEVSPFDALSIRVNFVGNNAIENKSEKVKSYFAAHKNALDWAYNNLDDAVELWGNAIDNDNYDLLKQAVQNGYPHEALKLNAFKGLDDAIQVAVDFDFIDDQLSQDERNELFDNSVLPGSSGDEFS